MILFDGVHLASDETLTELHRIADQLGLKRAWFQSECPVPHYDVFGRLAAKLTVNCSVRELVLQAVRY